MLRPDARNQAAAGILELRDEMARAAEPSGSKARNAPREFWERDSVGAQAEIARLGRGSPRWISPESLAGTASSQVLQASRK